MNISEFIVEELKTLAGREMKFVLTDFEQQQVMGVLNSFPPEGELKTLFVEITNLPFFSKLKYLKILVQDLNTDDLDIKTIETKLKGNPLIRAYSLIWVYSKVESFRNDEFLDAEYSEFLKIVLDKYDYLINLNDFLFNTGVLLLKPQYEQWDPEIFLPPLELAKQKYPHKYGFTKLLAEVHLKNEGYLVALSLLDTLILSVEEASIQNKNQTIGDKEFTYSDYLEGVQMIGLIHYKLGDFEHASTCFDRIINNLPVVYFNDHEGRDVLSYLDTYLTRMCISLKDGRNTEVLRDYEIIKAHMYFYENAENEYPAVFEFLRNQKIVWQSKQH